MAQSSIGDTYWSIKSISTPTQVTSGDFLFNPLPPRYIIRTIDHGRSDEPGYGANWKKIARFEKLENFSSVFKTT